MSIAAKAQDEGEPGISRHAQTSAANIRRHQVAVRPIGRTVLLCSIVLCALAVVLSLVIGPTGMSIGSLPAALSALSSANPSVEALQARLVLIDLRLPRTLVGLFVGASLAVAGAMMQGLFRNPLADPGLIGVSAGAALAAIATIALADGILGWWVSLAGLYALPVSAFLGGIVTTGALLAVAGRSGQMSMATLLLAGIAFGAIAGAFSGLIAYVSDDRELRDLTLWSMGSLTGASWDKVAAVAPFAATMALVLPFLVRALNALLLGEAEAFHLGIDVERTKLAIIVVTAAAVGAAVAVAGVIGFVGIVVPHLVRLIAGPDHRVLIPAAAALGGALLLVADVLARTIAAPAELPIGILMALIGAPVFLHLVLKRGTIG